MSSLQKTIIHRSKKLIKGTKEALDNIQKKIKTLQEVEEKNGSIKMPRLPSAKGDHIVDVSLMSAIKIIAVVFGIMLFGDILTQIGEILILFFLSLFLASALHPGVEFLGKYKILGKYNIPRTVGVIIVYILVVGMLIFLVAELFPAIVEQLIRISQWAFELISDVYKGNFINLPEWMQKYAPQLQDALQSLNESIKNITENPEDQAGILEILNQNIEKMKNLGTELGSGIYSFAMGFITWIFNLVMVLVLTFFIISDTEAIQRFFVGLFPLRFQPYIIAKSTAIQQKIAEWVHGQVILFFIVGIIAWIGLSLIGVEYALLLAFVAGLAEFLPYIGPSIAFITAAPIAFGSGLDTGFAVIIFYTLLQVFEGNILVPLVMKKAVGLPPIVTIIAMLIGWEFLGILGTKPNLSQK